MKIKKIIRNNFIWNLFLFSCIFFLLTEILIGAQSSFLLSLLNSNKDENIILLLIIALILMIIPIIFRLIAELMQNSFIKNFMITIRNYVFLNILKMNIFDFAKKNNDDLISISINDIDNFKNQYFSSFYKIIISFSLIIVGFLIILLLDNVVFNVLVIFVIFMIFILQYFKRTIKRLNHEISIINSKYLNHVLNVFLGINIIKSNAAELYFIKKHETIIKRQAKLSAKLSFISACQNIISSKLKIITLIFSILYLSYKISSSEISFENGILLLIILTIIFQNLFDFFDNFSFFKNSEKLLNDKMEYIRNNNYEDNKNLEAFKSFNNLAFSNVSYKIEEKIILNEFSFILKKKHKYLLIGESGSGKTTLLNIIAKIKNNYDGSIYYDTQELKIIDDDSYFKNVEYVMQDIFLFDDSIINNITLYRKYSEAEISNSIKKSGLLNFIKSLSAGLNYKLINNGNNISAGQRQKIAIARSILRKSEILLIDEISANLPKKDADEIEEILLNMDKTLIFSSHRFSRDNLSKYDGIITIKNNNVSFVETCNKRADI